MPDDSRSPISATPDGVRIAVRVTPRASRARVKRIVNGADGCPYVAVDVSAAPEDGKANAALIKLLAKELRVAKSTIAIVAGATSRRKTLHIAGDPGRLLLDLGGWVDDMR